MSVFELSLRDPKRRGVLCFVSAVVRGPKRKRVLRFTFEEERYDSKRETLVPLARHSCDMSQAFVRISHMIDAGWRIVS